jgi:GH15 family glucan-1,4-alpha-glucosidase
MPRDLPVGNGRLLVCFDRNYVLRDLYYPHVGQENHVNGNSCRTGVFDGKAFSWVGEGWDRRLAYEADTLVTRADLYHKDLGLLVTCRDVVDFHEDVYVREIRVENLRGEDRRIAFFFSHDFDISGNSIGDTATYDPTVGGIVHYKGARFFLVNGVSAEDRGPSQFAVGVKNVGGKEGTFRDAEDGVLSGNPVAQGSVDSVISLGQTLKGHGVGLLYYWICAGESWEDVRRIDAVVRRKHPAEILRRTGAYWNLWVRKEPLPPAVLPLKVETLYRRSLLLLHTQIDWQGGIIAANDSDAIQYNRDTYSYVWSRDGALAANALDLAGYPEPARRFYQFAATALDKEGYLLHKYNPDGTLASSWHAWYGDDGPQLPIQEDETALVLWALWQHFVLYRDIEFVKPLYRPLVKRAADFMVRYRDGKTGLPGPSYDLWEERRGIPAFTVGAVFGGLTAASLFCTIFGETERAEAYQGAASEIRDGASRYLWREDLGRFCRMVYRDAGGALAVDGTLDSSLWGLFAFGVYTPDDPRIVQSMDNVRERLWLKTGTGGMARYENDGYYRVSPEVPGNPWFVSTLWLADYVIRKGKKAAEWEEALSLIRWAADHALPSGVMAEQVHPFSGDPLSVSPLTWSHATYVSVVQRYLRRLAQEEGLSSKEKTEDWIGRLFSQACDAIHGACAIK